MNQYFKGFSIILISSIVLIGCDGNEGLGENPLRAKARENERQPEQQDVRAQETKYGTDISNAFKNKAEKK